MHLITVLIPFSTAAFGWYLGRRSFMNAETRLASRLRHDYFVGLNYLINEQPDKAVDVFIKMLEVDTDTVEVHLALGNLFRRRGEVDRAIRIHQNLIARPQLVKAQRIHALAELGQDYLKAGVLDRAERLFLELANTSEDAIPSLRYLLNIYQQQKDWEQAVTIAQKLQSITGETKQKEIAHFYCELAEKMYEKNNKEQAQRYLKKAQTIDKNCARASLMQAKLEEAMGLYKAAINNYKLAREQNPAYFDEIVESLISCYAKLNDENSLLLYLEQCLENTSCISATLAYVDLLQQRRNTPAAIDFLAERIRANPSLRGLSRLINLYLDISEEPTRNKLLIIRNLVDQLLRNKPIYRCTECGIAGKTLYWQCPGCKNWSTTKPIQGLEGE